MVIAVLFWAACETISPPDAINQPGTYDDVYWRVQAINDMKDRIERNSAILDMVPPYPASWFNADVSEDTRNLVVQDAKRAYMNEKAIK